MYVSAKEVIYDNALELWRFEHPDCKTEPTVEQLKEEGYWEKAIKEKEMKPETFQVPIQLKMEHEQLKEFESKLKKLTSSFSANIVEVEINKIIPCSVLPPRHLGDLHEFAKSIGKISLLAPLILRKSKEKQGAYEVVCGHRRFEALKILHKKKVQAKVFDELPDEYVFAVSAIENWFHKSLSGTEWATHLDKWKKSTGWSQRQIARFLGVTEQAISQYFRLLKLPDKIKNLNAFKFLSVNMGLSLLRIKDEEKQMEIMKDFNNTLKEKPYMSQPKLNKEFARIMKKHRENMPVKSLTQMLVQDFYDMMKRDQRTRNAFVKYFTEACFKAELYEQCYDEAFHYVELATDKKIADISFDMNIIKDEIIVDVNSYQMKYAGSFELTKEKEYIDSYQWMPWSEWVPFELRFKSYKL